MVSDVYADLLFLVNFSMDFLCAYLTASLLRRRAVPWRLFAASALGGIYAVAALFWRMSPMGAVAADVGVCLVMCVLLFYERGVPLRFLALSCAIFVGVSMAMGGMMTALFNLLNRAGFPVREMGEERDGISAWLFAAAAGISTVMGLRGGKLLRRSAARRFARLSITLGERTVEVQALIDSGNLCRDPISGKPVVFLDPMRARSLLGTAQRVTDSPELARRFRLIPVETVNGKQLQSAYLPDRMTLTDGGGTHEIDALFAPAETLAGAGVYGAIVPSSLAV